VNMAAPPAPVAAADKAVGGKNRKAHGAGIPVALVKGMNKGSAQFQKLLAARAAARLRTGAAVPAAALAAASLEASGREASGLKNALVAALARSAATRAATAAAPASLPVAAHAAETAALAGKADAKKKKTGVPASPAVPVHAAIAIHAAQPALVKEAKVVAAEASKAPVVEPVRVAHAAEPLVRVVDLRSHGKQSPDASTAHRTDPAPSQDRDPSVIVTARPVSHEATIDSASRPAPAPAPAPTPLERLHEMAGSELVKASQLVLKDGGGEIRLLLKPESLGSVRVRMNLVDNAIEGRIIVDSAAVKHVMDGSVDALRRALTAEGFQMGSLQVSVGGQDAQSDPRRRQEEAPAEVRRIAARGFERSVPGAEDVSLGDLFVNMFV